VAPATATGAAAEGAAGGVLHPWGTRMLRTVQFALARLRSRDGNVEAHARPFDLTFTGPAQDVITRHIFRYGVHEPQISAYLIDRVCIGPEEIALDVGANLGWYSVLLDRLSRPGARILSFEPDPQSFALLEWNLARNSAARVTPYNLALGETPGMTRLNRYKTSNNGRHTLLDGDTSGGTVEVAVARLESFWETHGLGERRIRLMKVDVEGFEIFVLRGAGALLDRCDRIILEYSPTSLPIAHLPMQALPELLRAHGLRAHAFTPGGLEPVSFEQLAEAGEQMDLLLTRASGLPP
jgi:FkbM family methyltransferase